MDLYNDMMDRVDEVESKSDERYLSIANETVFGSVELPEGYTSL